MKFLVRRKTVIRYFAEELAYLQVSADYLCYIEKNIDMAKSMLKRILELSEFSRILEIESDVFDQSYKFYKYKNLNEKDFVPDLEYIKKKYRMLKKFRYLSISERK